MENWSANVTIIAAEDEQSAVFANVQRVQMNEGLIMERFAPSLLGDHVKSFEVPSGWSVITMKFGGAGWYDATIKIENDSRNYGDLHVPSGPLITVRDTLQ